MNGHPDVWIEEDEWATRRSDMRLVRSGQRKGMRSRMPIASRSRTRLRVI